VPVRPSTPRRPRGDDGNVLALVGVMLVAVFGIGALVVDLGLFYAEGRQLQNGAENGAMAVARTCATGSVCDPSQADTLANTNANDATSNVDLVCGTAPGLTACPASPQRPRYDCMPLASGLTTVPYAEVRTSTRRTDGGTLMPAALYRAVDPAEDGTQVKACARASYGTPLGLTSQLPLTFSMCEWLDATGNGTIFTDPALLPSPPPSPSTSYPWPSGEQVIHFHGDAAGAPSCPAGPAGQDLPGGFGWLDTNEDCVATTDDEGWVDDSTGAPPPNDCSNGELLAMRGKIVYIPLFGETNGLTGSNGSYKITGYAAFYLTGYYFTGGYRETSLVTGAYPCSGSQRCLSGYFTEAVAPATGQIGTGPSMGVTVVVLTG
jgi:hypothetical protein